MPNPSKKRFWFGVCATIAWSAICLIMVYIKRNELGSVKLNEWGDVFAGFVAPMAFLWFILSFLQQGDELKQNTKALELQAEELRQSVAHQHDMVQVTREQVHHELEQARIERERIRASAQPKFIYKNYGGMKQEFNHEYNLNFQNVGNSCTMVAIEIDPLPHRYGPLTFPSILREQDFTFKMAYNGPVEQISTLSISYDDATGARNQCEYLVTITPYQVECIQTKPFSECG